MRNAGSKAGKGFNGGSFTDRLETQQAARRAQLEKAQALAEKNKAGAPERAAERKRLAEEREKRQAERAEAKRLEAERLEAERIAAIQAAKDEAARLLAEQKARRDERYAKRKGKR
jgi:hypothetical protein